jgi:hypothetical protein
MVCEALADFRTASKLVDRRLQASEIDWLREMLEGDEIDSHRAWIGVDGTFNFVEWSDVPKILKRRGWRAERGHFRGRNKPEADALAGANVLTIARELRRTETIDAVVLVRDADNQVERRTGLGKARDAYGQGHPVVIGIAVRMREAWVLAGFDPTTRQEVERQENVRKVLGFDPVTKSHELRDSDESAVRSPKRVLAVLTDGDHERERRCYEETALQVLATRGTENGLADFLAETTSRLEPIFTKA